MATPHIESKLEDIAEVVLMPGDPLRAKYIAENFLTDYKLVNSVRNMLAYTGYYKNKRVTVFASGMGISSIGIYCYELYQFYNVKKIIRIGTSGSFHPDVKILDIVLARGAYSKTYFDQLFDQKDVDYITSSQDLDRIIMEKAKEKNFKVHHGKIITSDVFDLYVDAEKFKSNFPDDKYLAVEMEAFGLFYVAKRLKREAACLLTIVDSKYDQTSLTSEMREKSLNDMILLALDSVIS